MHIKVSAKLFHHPVLIHFVRSVTFYSHRVNWAMSVASAMAVCTRLYGLLQKFVSVCMCRCAWHWFCHVAVVIRSRNVIDTWRSDKCLVAAKFLPRICLCLLCVYLLWNWREKNARQEQSDKYANKNVKRMNEEERHVKRKGSEWYSGTECEFQVAFF